MVEFSSDETVVVLCSQSHPRHFRVDADVCVGSPLGSGKRCAILRLLERMDQTVSKLERSMIHPRWPDVLQHIVTVAL